MTCHKAYLQAVNYCTQGVSTLHKICYALHIDKAYMGGHTDMAQGVSADRKLLCTRRICNT